MKLEPVASGDPPVAAAYQFIVPLVAEAVNVSVPTSHRLAGVVDVMVSEASIVAITAILVDVQLPLLACT